MFELEVSLTFRSPLNIGSGAQHGSLAQRSMLKDKHGWLVVPASALKGRLRHAVEQVAQTLPRLGEIAITHRERYQRDVDVVGEIFGMPWYAGKVRFEDLPLTGPDVVKAHWEGLKKEGRRPRTTERMGVGINRRRRVAEDNFLYSTELMLPGIDLTFGGTMAGDISPLQAGLLLAGLKFLPAMGRSKSTGLGWVTATAKVKEGDKVWKEADLRELLKSGGNDESRAVIGTHPP